MNKVQGTRKWGRGWGMNGGGFLGIHRHGCGRVVMVQTDEDRACGAGVRSPWTMPTEVPELGVQRARKGMFWTGWRYFSRRVV